MTREEALKTVKNNICGKCDYMATNMESCDWDCENREAIKALEKKGVTNQEYIATLTPDEFWNTIRWLQKGYGKQYADSYQAIIEWLSAERRDEG